MKIGKKRIKANNGVYRILTSLFSKNVVIKFKLKNKYPRKQYNNNKLKNNNKVDSVKDILLVSLVLTL